MEPRSEQEALWMFVVATPRALVNWPFVPIGFGRSSRIACWFEGRFRRRRVDLRCRRHFARAAG